MVTLRRIKKGFHQFYKTFGRKQLFAIQSTIEFYRNALKADKGGASTVSVLSPLARTNNEKELPRISVSY